LWLGIELTAPGTNQRLIQETNDGLKLIENTDKGIQIRRLGDSLQALQRAPDIVTASLLNDAVTNALESLETEALAALRSRVQSEESKVLGTKGITPEYEEWIGDRNQILELLDR
jgi:flagellar motility protein MotE (MotC chaperone)